MCFFKDNIFGLLCLIVVLIPFFLQLLHGEQYLERLGPMPVEGTLVSTFKVTAVLDKGRVGGAVVADVVSRCRDTGKEVVRNQVVLATCHNW